MKSFNSPVEIPATFNRTLTNIFALSRFWETDIRAARKINRSTIRRKNTLNKSSWVLKDIVLWLRSDMAPSITTRTDCFRRNTFESNLHVSKDINASLLQEAHKKFKSLVSLFSSIAAHAAAPLSLPRYDDLLPRSRNLESSLEQALMEAADDATLRKIKRISYSANAATEVINLHPPRWKYCRLR